MGQIVFNGQKPKYCNLSAITIGSKKDYVIPAGEVWLIDSTNASKTDGTGKYDYYIIGDGSKTASQLAADKVRIDDSDEIVIDNAPTSGSNNAVSSGGVYQAIQAIDVSSQISGKQDIITTVNVNVDNNTGTPSGTASVSGNTFTLNLSNLKGAKGDTGATGATGPQGNTGVQVDSVASIIHSIDSSTTYAVDDVAGADSVQSILINADNFPIASSDNIIKSKGVYNLYAQELKLLDRDVTNWVRNIPISMTAGKEYIFSFSREQTMARGTQCILYDANDTSYTVFNANIRERITTYTPSVDIVKLSLYSDQVGHFCISYVNDDKILLTHDDVVDNFSAGGSNVPLSAEKGKELNDKVFFLNYYYHPISSGSFPTLANNSFSNNIYAGRAILLNQNITSLSVKDGYKFIIYSKTDNIRSSTAPIKITSDYITDRWVNTSDAAYLWVIVVKIDGGVIDCNELNNILIVEYNGAKAQFNKIYTQEDLYRLGRKEDLAVDYVNGSISIDYGTMTIDESASGFITDYIDVTKIIALVFVVASNYSSSNNSPSLPILWYDSNKSYIGHTNIQILQKDREAIVGIPDNASYAIFSGKRSVEAIYRQDSIEAYYRIGYKSVLNKLKKVSLIICHGQSLMVGADSESSYFASRKKYNSLIGFSLTQGVDRQKQDSIYSGFRVLTPVYNKESPRLGLGEMFIQTISKENNISIEANEWENHLLLMPSPAVGNTTIETFSSDSEYEYVEAHIRNAKKWCDEFGYELDAPAWVWFQGEQNIGSGTSKTDYKTALLNLHERICSSLTTIAGITTRPKCIIYQPSSQCFGNADIPQGYSSTRLNVPTAFVELLAENDEFIAAAPTYILSPTNTGGVYIHCDAESYNLLGAFAGYALKKCLIDGINVKGLIPLDITVNGNTIKIKYNVPSPPIHIDTDWVREVSNYGYNCIKSDDTDIISSVDVYWDEVTITCSESPIGCKLRYGLNGVRGQSADGFYGWCGRIKGGRGNIRDSQGNAVCKEMPNGKIYPMHNWAYCFEKLLEE